MKKKGFTLIELLISIAVIAVVSLVIFLAIDPFDRFKDARDTRRLEDIDSLTQAVYLYQVDNGGNLPPGIDGTWRMLGTSGAGCDVECQGLNVDPACIDMSVTLEDYLPEIPKDPRVGTDAKTYYALAVINNQIHATNCFTGQVGTLPLYSEYPGSTDFTSVPDLTAVDNLTLANPHGSIEFPEGYLVNASGEDYDSNVQIGEGFISVNPDNLDASFNSAVTLSFNNINCPTDIYYAADVYGSSAEVVNNGAICTGATDPSCTNISCNAGTIIFTAEHFSSYAVPIDGGGDGNGGNNIAVSDDLISYWKLNDNAEDEIGDNDGTVSGATYIDGRDGRGLSFDGSNDYVDFGTSNDFKSTEEITLSAWVNIGEFATWRSFVGSLWDTGSTESGYYLGTGGTANAVGFYLKTENMAGNNWGNAVVSNLELDTWYHLVGTYDGQTIKLYVDGQLVASDNETGNLDYTPETNGLFLGRYYDDNEDFYFDGSIDEVRFYNRAITLEEVGTLYGDVEELIEENNLVSYWNFDDNLLDQIGDNDATAQGTGFEAGVVNNALHLDNSSDYIDIPLTDDLKIAGDLSISFWTKLDSISSRTFFVYSKSGEDEEDNTLYELQLESNGDVEYKHEYNNGSNIRNTFDANLETDTFYHIALVREANASEVRVYIDGVLLDSFVYANAPTGGDLAKLYIGSDYAGTNDAINGIMDEFKIYNTVRSAEEILQEYNDNKPAEEVQEIALTVDYWMDIGNVTIDQLRALPNYPDNPTTSTVISSFDIPQNIGSTYGARVEALLEAPTTGDYTFYFASDDYGELWMSTDETEANKSMIAEVPGWTTYQLWTKYPAQQSAPITLQAGQKYYIEGIFQEAWGADHMSVAWVRPGEVNLEVIPGEFLEGIE